MSAAMRLWIGLDSPRFTSLDVRSLPFHATYTPRRLLGPLAEHTVVVFLVALALTVAAATLAHRLVDRPLLVFRDRLRA